MDTTIKPKTEEARGIPVFSIVQKQNYLEHPSQCPFCGSDSINTSDTDGASMLTMRADCDDCEKEWFEVYKLIDVYPAESGFFSDGNYHAPTYTDQLNTMFPKMVADIVKKVKEKGEQSDHRNEKVIKIPADSEYDYNLDDGHEQYLTEVSETELISEHGYSYPHSVLTMGQLAELTDYINSL